MRRLALAFLLFASPAFAQQQQPQQTPAESALQMNSVIGAWAQTIMQQGKTIEALQKQLSTANNDLAQARAKIHEFEKPKDEPQRAQP